LEALFKDASGNGTDDPKLLDYRRYQTPPNRQQSLMKCSAIAHIVASTQRVIDSQVHGYSDGELLSVIFAMLDDTKLDICENHEDRKTYSIPSGSIFLFSGRCRHGGSSYATHNLRIHMFFAKNQLVKVWKKENTVPLVFHCPVTDCVCNTIKKQSFTKSQWYDHWRHVHRDKFGISVGKYLKQIAGSKVYQCSDCLKGFTSNDGLQRHKRSRCKVTKEDSIHEENPEP
jgi:hypothetical protein